MKQILTLKQAAIFSEKLHHEGKKIVLVGGCFDILHIGHIRFLQKAKSKADVLFVLLESDERIHATKGNNRPIHSQEQRAEVLSALSCVDAVVLLPYLQTDREYAAVTKQLSPAIIATTKGDPQVGYKIKQAKEIGATVAYVTNHIKKVSTSNILSKFLDDRSI